MTESTAHMGRGVSSDAPALTIVPDPVPVEGEVIETSPVRVEAIQATETLLAVIPAPEAAPPAPVAEAPAPVTEETSGGFTLADIRRVMREETDIVRREMQDAVSDVEFRLAQTYEIDRRREQPEMGAQRIYVEDLVDRTHRMTGYTMLSNSNGTSTVNGNIAWSNLHIVFMGVDYTIANGTTPNKYAWFVRPGSYTPGTTADVVLTTSNTQPVLGANDALIFINNAGTVISALETSIPVAIAPGTVGDDQVTSLSQSKISGLAGVFTNLNDKITLAQAAADGAITQWFGPDFPWANGTTQDPAKTGDVYTVQSTTDPTNRPNGTSYKWSGPNGSPANTWILIEDANLSKALADAAAANRIAKGKTTVYYLPSGTPPTAPTEGFSTSDEWVQTDLNNKRMRWTGPSGTPANSWTEALIGNAGISGIAGGKVGAGINAGFVDTGTMSGARVGAGINGANVTDGTIGQPQIGKYAVTPAKMATSYHLLY